MPDEVFLVSYLPIFTFQCVNMILLQIATVLLTLFTEHLMPLGLLNY